MGGSVGALTLKPVFFKERTPPLSFSLSHTFSLSHMHSLFFKAQEIHFPISSSRSPHRECIMWEESGGVLAYFITD